jgi:hypothetical protein
MSQRQANVDHANILNKVELPSRYRRERNSNLHTKQSSMENSLVDINDSQGVFADQVRDYAENAFESG